ncbi:hypothetical protein [Burkholderia glumae]|uniref:hypothetical protein n=1 Tax=Burkholderia glumae TaxID=337 RepID=UPI002036E562|nr:hypothetical protein [Burkholderia glumae]MCM2491103.1 hypothetical protein [Burkholderia glumae]
MRGRPIKSHDEQFRDRIRTVATMHALAWRAGSVVNANQFARWFDRTMGERHPLLSWGTARSGKWTKNFAGDVTLTKGSVDHLHELFPDTRFYSSPDPERRRQDVQLFYPSPTALGWQQSARDLFEFGPGYLWRAMWEAEDDPAALWEIYAGYNDGVAWGATERFGDVVADLEMKLWSNVRAGVPVEAEDLGRAIVLYRLQWEAGCGGFPVAVSIHSCLWLAMAKWFPLLDIVQVWGELRDHFVWWELNNLDLYPEYRQLIERQHRSDARFDAMMYARNPFRFRPSDDHHSAALAMLLDMPSRRRKGI